MTLEERNILIADLACRVPYDTIVRTPYSDEVYLRSVDTYGYEVCVADYGENVFDVKDVKPYLRSLSSMTEEEFNELSDIAGLTLYPDGKQIPNGKEIIWLLSHYFDYRGLIEKDLALEAPEDMYFNKN